MEHWTPILPSYVQAANPNAFWRLATASAPQHCLLGGPISCCFSLALGPHWWLWQHLLLLQHGTVWLLFSATLCLLSLSLPCFHHCLPTFPATSTGRNSGRVPLVTGGDLTSYVQTLVCFRSTSPLSGYSQTDGWGGACWEHLVNILLPISMQTGSFMYIQWVILKPCENPGCKFPIFLYVYIEKHCSHLIKIHHHTSLKR